MALLLVNPLAGLWIVGAVQENVSGVVVISTSSSLAHNGVSILATGNLYVGALIATIVHLLF
jgi:hypothetical protein